MTLSAVSNTVLAKSHVSHQKVGTDSKQAENGRSNSSSENDLAGSKFDDNVTLGQSQKMTASSEVIDAKAAETLLPRTMQSILDHSKTAMSAQANTIPQAAQEILAEN